MPPRWVLPSWKQVSHGVVMAILYAGSTWPSAFIALHKREREWEGGRVGGGEGGQDSDTH